MGPNDNQNGLSFCSKCVLNVFKLVFALLTRFCHLNLVLRSEILSFKNRGRNCSANLSRLIPPFLLHLVFLKINFIYLFIYLFLAPGQGLEPWALRLKVPSASYVTL